MPILRIWGHFQVVWQHQWPLWEPNDINSVIWELMNLHPQFKVCLEDHDRKNVRVDISNPHWYKELEGLDGDSLNVDRKIASQHFTLRGDRFSTSHSWKPHQPTVHYEIEHQKWVAIRLVLVDKARPREPREFYPSRTQLLECVGEYLHRFGSKTKGGPKSLPLLDGPRNNATIFLRGRKRRNARRRARANSKGSLSEISTDKTQATPNAPSNTGTQLRGRIRKRRRRGPAFSGKAMAPVSDVENSHEASLDEMHEVHPIPVTSQNEQNNLPEHLRNVSQVLVAEWKEDGIYGPEGVRSCAPNGNIAIPINTSDGSRTLGCLFVAKEALEKSSEKPKPWYLRISDDLGHEVEVTNIGIQETFTPKLPVPTAYWEKFPVRASEHFKHELRFPRPSNSHLGYLLQWSFNSPMLLSPDRALGPLADMDEYSANSFLATPTEFESKGIEGRDTRETFNWLLSKGSIWENKRAAWAFIQLHDMEDVVPSETVTTVVDKPPDLPNERTINSSSLAKDQRHFTRALASMDEDDYNYGRSLIDDIEGEEDNVFAIPTFPRDIFYGVRYLALLPLWVQENYSTTVKELSFDSKNIQVVRAHAMLQYALCLLSGFGVVEDRDQGLDWFYSAAKAGNRKARAVVHRLFRSYGRTPPDCGQSLEWLTVEAKSGSQWALDELKQKDPISHEITLKEKLNEWSRSWGQSIATYQNTKSRASASGTERFPLKFHHKDLISALVAGRVDIAFWILDGKLGREGPYGKNRPNPLFFLLQIPHQEVQSIVQKLVELGEDVNEQTWVRNTSEKNEWPLSGHPVYNSFRPRGWNIDKHWKYQGKGLSITPLRWAIVNHNAALVKALLDSGATFPKVPDVTSYKDLHAEAFDADLSTVAILDVPCYDIDILRMFLDRHGNQATRTVFAETPLGLIATEPNSSERRLRLGELATPEYLFPVLDLLRPHQLGSDPELFRAAVMTGHLDIVKYLVTNGVDIEIRCSGLTPLHTAILYGKRDIFIYLLQQGANASALTTEKGISSIHLIFWQPKPVALEMLMLAELSKTGADKLGLNCPFAKKVSPLHLAVLGSRVEAVAKLIELGMDKCTILDDELMPSIQGARHTEWGINRFKETTLDGVGMGKRKVVVIPIKGCTPVGIVLQRWDMFLPEDLLKLLKLLCTNKDDLRHFYTKPDIKQTVLHLLACHSVLLRAGIFEYMLEQGRSVGLHINIQDAYGDTPLHYASRLISSTQGAVLTKFVEMGADPDVRNKYGMTPSDTRFLGHLNELLGTGEFPSTTFKFGPAHGSFEKRTMRGRRGDKGGSDRDGPCSVLWASLCDGVIFRRAWDLHAGVDYEFDQDMIVRVGDVWGSRLDLSYVDE